MSNGRKPRKQHYLFAHLALRQVAFDKLDDAVELLRGDRAAGLLALLWENCRKAAAQDGDVDTFDAMPVAKPQEFGALIGSTITMPKAERMTEAYYIAVIGSRSTAFAEYPNLAVGAREYFKQKGWPQLQYFTLEWTLTSQGQPAAVLCEWNAAGTHGNFDLLVQPNEPDFVAAVSKFATDR